MNKKNLQNKAESHEMHIQHIRFEHSDQQNKCTSLTDKHTQSDTHIVS